MKLNKNIVASLIMIMATGSLYLSAQEHSPYVGSKAFEQLKGLVGSWEGMMEMGEGPMKITADYKLTSGGSAIVETVFKGAPHEMISVFHDNHKGKLSMTHYCALHNQPKMALKSSNKNELKFKLSKDADIDVANEIHMHSLTIKFDGNDKMTQYWTNFTEGKKGDVVEIAYKRIQ